MSYLLLFLGLVGAAWYRRNRKTIWSSLGAAAILGGGITAAVVLGSDTPQKTQIPTPPSNNTTTLSFDIVANMSRMLAHGTSDNQFCGALSSVGLTAPAHCWQFGGATVTDLGSVGGWDLTGTGSPTTGVVTGLPIDSGGSADVTAELGTILGSGKRWVSTAKTQTETDLTFTIVWREQPNALTRVLYEHNSGVDAIRIYLSSGIPVARVNGATATVDMIGVGQYADSVWHCGSFVISTSLANASAIYVDGWGDKINYDLTGAGTPTLTSAPTFGAQVTGANAMIDALSRARLDYSRLSRVQHAAACGSMFGRTLVTDTSYSPYREWHFWDDGNIQWCTKTGAHTANCWDSTKPGWNLDETNGVSIPVWATGGVNRILHSISGLCTSSNYSCAVATIAAGTAPDSSPTASAITMGGGTVDISGTGYTGSAVVYPVMWAKCSSGTLTIANQADTGSWTVNCATVAGAWELLTPTHPAVTVAAAPNNVWHASAGGTVQMRFSGTDASIWAPTVTLTQPISPPITIPTQASVGTYGPSYLYVDNTNSAYYHSGATVTPTVSEDFGSPCWSPSSPYLSLYGASGTPCGGNWSGLSIVGASGSSGSAYTGTVLIIQAGQSNADGVVAPGDLPAAIAYTPASVEYWRDGIFASQRSRRRTYGDWATWGPEAPTSWALVPRYPHANILWVKRALSSTSLYCIWRPGGCDAGRCATTGEACGDYQYNLLVSDLSTALNGRVPDHSVLYWLQGERDAKLEVSANDYATALDNFVSTLQTDTGLMIDQTILVRIADLDIVAYPYKATVRATQDAAATSSPGGVITAVIDRDAYGSDDNIHLNAAGLQTLGPAAAGLVSP